MNLQQIGARLAAEREFRNWTCPRLIEELGFPRRMTSRTILSIEKADTFRYPSLRTVMDLLDVYGLEFTIVRKGDDGQ